MPDPATMSDRELDAACAVIAGWETITPYTPYVVSVKSRGFVCDGVPYAFPDHGVVPTARWSPTTDWSAAMSLLDVVREWPTGKQDDFIEELLYLCGFTAPTDNSLRYGVQSLLVGVNRLTPRTVAQAVYEAHACTANESTAQ